MSTLIARDWRDSPRMLSSLVFFELVGLELRIDLILRDLELFRDFVVSRKRQLVWQHEPADFLVVRQSNVEIDFFRSCGRLGSHLLFRFFANLFDVFRFCFFTSLAR